MCHRAVLSVAISVKNDLTLNIQLRERPSGLTCSMQCANQRFETHAMMHIALAEGYFVKLIRQDVIDHTRRRSAVMPILSP
jgi:hypothetical protein